MADKVLSIIIPTYNMEKYIPKCLDSLIIPSIDKLDIIVVNDGSKDQSSEIAHSYAKKYPDSIRVIDKENGNYGSCINAAIPTIKGKYVKILDSDDSFDNPNLEEFIIQLSKINADLVLSNYEKVDESGKALKIFTTSKILSDQLLPINDILKLKFEYLIAMHAFAYSSNILKHINYKQTEGISYTDTEWHTIPVAYCSNFYYYDKIIYKYLVGREGQTIQNDIFLKKTKDLIIIASNLVSYFNKNLHLFSDTGKKYFLNRLFDFLGIIYYLILIHSNDSSKNEELINLDKKIEEFLPSIHKRILNEFTITPLKFKYIKYWYNKNKNSNIKLFKVIKTIKKILNKSY